MYELRLSRITTIAAAEAKRAFAGFREHSRQHHDGRGFAGSTKCEIADAQYGHSGRHAFHRHAPCSDSAIESAEWRKQARSHASRPPPERRLTHGGSADEAEVASGRGRAMQAFDRARHPYLPRPGGLRR